MNNRQLVLMSVCALLGFSACSEKKQTKDIIVPKVVKKVQKKINTIPREKLRFSTPKEELFKLCV